MKKWSIFLPLLVLFLWGCGQGQSNTPKDPVSVVLSAGQVGLELEHLQSLIEIFNKENPDIKAQIKDYSGVPQQQLDSIQQVFLAKSSELDVVQIDVIWPGDLAENLIDLRSLQLEQNLIDAHFPATITNNTVDGRLVAMPWFLDAGMMYYRDDLLQKYGLSVPKTWDELEQTSQFIQDKERALGNANFWGFVWQAGTGEGLTCVALELLVSQGAGTIIDASGSVSINNSRALEILNRAKSWIGTISPPEVLTYNGAEGPRKFWETGNALFMRNWPYAFSMGNREESLVKGKFKIAPLPAGASGKGASTLGGWQLGINKFSKYPNEALRLLKFLTSERIQRKRAVESGYYPTIRSLYSDGTLAESSNPIFSQLADVLETTVARPSTWAAPHYNNFSQLFFTKIHLILSNSADAKVVLKELEEELNRLLSL